MVWVWIDAWLVLSALALVVVVAMARAGEREDLGRARRADGDSGDDVED